MGKITLRKPVKLIIGFIFEQKSAFDKSRAILIRRFGRIDFESRIMPFTLTDYYTNEFGTGLKRVFLSFSRLIHPQRISGIKVLAQRIERRISCAGKRLVNIDPGYLDLAKLILASSKDYAHRIYLDKGIYAEITLVFRGRSFQPWDWTYPDYHSSAYLQIFNEIRQIYAAQVKNI